MIWVAVSALLIETIQGTGHGIKSEAHIFRDKYRLVVSVFVYETGIVEGYLPST